MATSSKTTRSGTASKKADTTSTRKSGTSAAAKIKDMQEAEQPKVAHVPDVSEPALESADQTPDVVIAEILPLSTQDEMKKKELIDLAVARSGVKKRDAKPAIEAALAILGEALAEGREMNLLPMGKLKVTRMKKAGNGQIINARVRQPEENDSTVVKEADFEDIEPLAQPAE